MHVSRMVPIISYLDRVKLASKNHASKVDERTLAANKNKINMKHEAEHSRRCMEYFIKLWILYETFNPVCARTCSRHINYSANKIRCQKEQKNILTPIREDEFVPSKLATIRRPYSRYVFVVTFRLCLFSFFFRVCCCCFCWLLVLLHLQLLAFTHFRRPISFIQFT